MEYEIGNQFVPGRDEVVSCGRVHPTARNRRRRDDRRGQRALQIPEEDIG